MEIVAFASSVIEGFQEQRGAVRRVILELQGLEFPIRAIFAEDQAASGASSRGACLNLVRQSNVVILLLGKRYGSVSDASGLSVTHEEYREARKLGKPVIALIERCEREDQQQEFVREVEDYVHGTFRAAYDSLPELERECRKSLLGLLARRFRAEPHFELGAECVEIEYLGAFTPARRKLLEDLKANPIVYTQDRGEETSIEDSWEALMHEARALHRRGYAEISIEEGRQLGIHWRYSGLLLAEEMRPYAEGQVERMLLLRLTNVGGKRAEHVQANYTLLGADGEIWGEEEHKQHVGFVGNPAKASEIGWGIELDSRLMLNASDQAWVVIRFPYENLRWAGRTTYDDLPEVLRVSITASNSQPANADFMIEMEPNGTLRFASAA